MSATHSHKALCSPRLKLQRSLSHLTRPEAIRRLVELGLKANK
jgi:hypothetical protein